MYKKTRRKRLRYELIFLIIGVLCLSGAGFFDFLGFSIPSALVVDNDDIFATLFTVQATTTTLSIAVLTLLTGNMKDSHAGISITRYLTSLRPILLKHRTIIIVNVLLTLINYFLVSLKRYNLSVAVFTTCVLITVYLIIDIYSVLKGTESLNQEIDAFYLNNYKKLGFKDIETAVFLTPDTIDPTDYHQNICLIKEFYADKITNGDIDFNDLDSLMARILKSLLLSEDKAKIEHFYSVLCDIYKQANDKQEIIHLNLWDKLSWDYYRSLRIIDLLKTNNHRNVELLHAHLYRNQQIEVTKTKEGRFEYKIITGYDLSSFATQVYFAAYSKKEELKEKSTRFKDYLYVIRSIIAEIDYRIQDNTIIDYQKDLLQKELSLLFRYLIYNGEFDALEKYVFQYDRDKINHYQIAITIALIYIYYLNIEPITPSAVLKNTCKITSQNKIFIHSFLFSSDYNIQKLCEYYDFIQDTMMLWEEMPEDENGKLIIMDTAIQHFLVLSAANNPWAETNLGYLFQILFSGNMYSAYTTYSYKERSNVDDILKKYLLVFQYYSETEADSPEKQEERLRILQQIESSSVTLFKDEEIKSRENYRITDETEREFSQQVVQHINKFTADNSYLFDCVHGGEYSGHDNVSFFFTDILSTVPKYPNFDNQLKRRLESILIKSIIKRVHDNLRIISAKDNQKNKQQLLINCLKDLNVSPDTMLGTRDVFFGEENSHLLSESFSDIHKIPYDGGYNNIYYIDSQRIHFRFFDVEIHYRNLDEKEIMELSKKDDNGNLLFRTINGVYLPFSKQEYIEYMNSAFKRVYIFAKIEWRIDDEIVGAGLEIKE